MTRCRPRTVHLKDQEDVDYLYYAKPDKGYCQNIRIHAQDNGLAVYSQWGRIEIRELGTGMFLITDSDQVRESTGPTCKPIPETMGV